MTEFVQMMKDWRRMCETIQSENQQTSSGGWCIGCPIQGVCVIDAEIKYTTDNGLAMIGERIQSWAAENPEPVYPTWGEWLLKQGVIRAGTESRNGFAYQTVTDKLFAQIDADIAKKLGIEPKEGT